MWVRRDVPEPLVVSGRAESMLIKNTLAKDPTRGTLDALFAIHNLLRPGTAPAPEVWTEEDFMASSDQLVHVHDFLQMWQEAEENATETVNRETQRSTEDRMIRFAQERGIKYVWENFREERTEKTGRGARLLVYELSRVLTVYTAVWRLLFQPRAALTVSGSLSGDGAKALTDYGEYSEESLNKRYDLGRVGRYKINQRLQPAFAALGFSAPPAGMTALTAQDVLAILLYFAELPMPAVPARYG